MNEGTIGNRIYTMPTVPELDHYDELREFWGEDSPWAGPSVWVDILLPSAVTFAIIYCLVQIGLSFVNLDPGGLMANF